MDNPFTGRPWTREEALWALLGGTGVVAGAVLLLRPSETATGVRTIARETESGLREIAEVIEEEALYVRAKAEWLFTTKPSVPISKKAETFLNELAFRLEGDVPIFVNSTVRDARGQASAMLAKYAYAEEQGGAGAGAKDLLAIYPDAIAVRLLRLPRTVDAWADEITRMRAEGLTVSRHMDGDAIDLKIKGFDEGQIARLQAMVTRLGARPLREGNPPHLHVDHLPADPTAVPLVGAVPSPRSPRSLLAALAPRARLAVRG